MNQLGELSRELSMNKSTTTTQTEQPNISTLQEFPINNMKEANHWRQNIFL